MGNPFHILLALVLVLLYPTGSEPLWILGPDVPPHLPLFIVLLDSLLFALISLRGMRAGRTLPSGGLRILSLLFFAAEVSLAHWPRYVERVLGLESQPLSAGLLLLSPYLARFSVLACLQSLRESEGYRTELRRLLIFRLRFFLVISLLPIVMILGLYQVFHLSPSLQRLLYIHPHLGLPLMIAIVGLLSFSAPTLLRAALSAVPLAPGALRDRLQDFCQRSGFGRPVILVLPPSGPRLANAFITGLIPAQRRIFFTDATLRLLPVEEVEAVLAHEIAHGRKRHLWTLSAVSLAWMTLTPHLPDAGGATGGALLTLAPLFLWISLLGYISRRFESEADLVGVRLLSQSLPPEQGLAEATFRLSQALHRVCQINRSHPGVHSFRHFSILRRTALLESALLTPIVGAAWERKCSTYRRAAYLLALGGLLAWIPLVQAQEESAPARSLEWAAFEKASTALRRHAEGRGREALELLEEAVREGAAALQPALYVRLARLRDESGDSAGAREALREAARHDPTDPDLRIFLRSLDRTEGVPAPTSPPGMDR